MALAEHREDEVDSEVVGKDDVEGQALAVKLVTRRIEQIKRSPDVEGAFKIKLFFKNKSLGECLVEAFDVTLDDDSEEKAEEIVKSAVEDLLDKDDADLPRSGTVKYCVRVSMFPQATNFDLRIAVQRPNGAFGDPDPVESTTSGVVQSLVEAMGVVVKHADNNAKQNGADLRAVIAGQGMQIRNLMAENAELKRTQLEMIRNYEELISKNFERKMLQRRAEREEEKEQERDEMIASFAKLLGPPLLAQAGLIPPQLAAAASNMFAQADQAKAAESQAKKETEAEKTEAMLWAEDFAIFEEAFSRVPQDQLFGVLGPYIEQKHIEALMRMKERAAKSKGRPS